MRCPYETNSRKCTHKGTAPKKSNRRRFCGYGNPNDCILFQEWVEIVNACDKASKGFYELSEDKDDI